MSLSCEAGVQISEEIHQLWSRINLWILFMPPAAVTSSAGFQMYANWKKKRSLRGIIPLCSVRLQSSKSLALFILIYLFWGGGVSFPVLWMSLLLCYTLINCIIAKCAPPPETPFSFSQKKKQAERMGRWDSVFTKSAFWKVGQRADQALCAEEASVAKMDKITYLMFIIKIMIIIITKVM